MRLTARTMRIDDQTLAVLDVETTGLNPALGDRICEVGIVLARGDEALDAYQTLVNPQRPISPGASAANGLCDQDVCDAPTFGEVAGEVLRRVDGALLVCHNAPFDLGFLDAEFSRLGQPWGPAGVIDTLQIAREHFDFGSNSLGSLAAALGIRNPQAHRALGDAQTTLNLLRALTRRLAPRGVKLERLVRSYAPAAPWAGEGLLPDWLGEALHANRPVEIVYFDKQGVRTRRTITPTQVFTANGVTYLVAFCHLRQEERQFRLDRIQAIVDAP